MATKTPADVEDLEERIIDIDVSSEMETSYLEYAYSVIYARALPDARDGLKPVQRRILYTMHDMGLRPDKPHVKCARVVGQVMGLLHPHGDSAIYDALVRLGQDWSMRLPTIDGHGNFGSLDAGPAAYRYTECRLAPPAMAMVAGIDQDTVDFRPNYDGKELEPAVLPAAFPNLLVNGASGIAVGMATNLAPHNLVEVVGALKHLLGHPDADLNALMRYIPGPDFPTGGTIIGLSGVRDAYASGRGSFKLRATCKIEQVTPRRKGIVVTSLPHGVGPEKIMEQIKDLVSRKKVSGIADVKDLTDLTNGTRMVIEIKNGINPDALLAQLFKFTKLEDTFAINAVALVDGQPRTLSLLEMLQVYLDHRIDVTTRRTKFQLGKATDRLHLVEGMLLALLDIDDVIAIIRSSEDVAEARARLIEAFELTEVQANYILDLQLRRLTKLSRIELESERDELRAEIERLTRILDDEQVLHKLVADELDEVVNKFGTPRRTVLLADSGAAASSAATAPLEIPDEPCWLMLSSAGRIARLDVAELPETSDDARRSKHDAIVCALRASTHAEYGVLTSHGRLIKAKAIELPSVPPTATSPNLQGGTKIADLVELAKGERALGLTSLADASLGLALGTRSGVVKRVNAELLASKDEWSVINLADGDEVVGALELHDLDDELVFITSDAQLLHFSASLVRGQGRGGSGMAGIKLGKGAHVVWFGAAPAQGSVVVTVSGSSSSLPGTEPGSVKVSDFGEYPSKGRATGGVRCHRFLKGEDTLMLGWAGPAPAIAASSSGSAVELPPATGRRDGSGTPAAKPIAAVASRHLRP